MGNKKSIKICLYVLLALSPLLLLRLGGSNNLVGSLANLPGLADTPDKGALVELIKAIDEVYTEGTIKLEVFPFARSMDNVVNGKADFHAPIAKNPLVPESKLPYRYVTERMGKFALVIYSHVDKPLTKKMIDNAVAKGGEFPYKIEVSPGNIATFQFKATPSFDITQSFKKVEGKRIDAVIRAQDEMDMLLKDLRLKTIHRALWGDREDCMIISKSKDGDKVDKILSDSIKKLKASGRLQKIYSRIHVPYDDWQPSKMGW